MNTYSYFAPNVFLARCPKQYERDSVIPVTTKHGKVNNCIVFKLIYEKEGFYYYSIIREDGFNAQVRAQNKADRLNAWAASAEKKSNDFYVRSNKDRAFLSLGEPIKVGHHSERRHRKIIAEANYNMGKSVEYLNKAAAHESKAEYWENKTDVINLSMPESIDFYAYKLEQAKAKHEGLKKGTIPKRHSFDVQYANKAVKVAKENYDLAVRLWQ